MCRLFRATFWRRRGSGLLESTHTLSLSHSKGKLHVFRIGEVAEASDSDSIYLAIDNNLSMNVYYCLALATIDLPQRVI